MQKSNEDWAPGTAGKVLKLVDGQWVSMEDLASGKHPGPAGRAKIDAEQAIDREETAAERQSREETKLGD